MKGFTLIEFIIIFGIMAVLVGAAITTLPDFKKNIDNTTFSNQIVSVLERAQIQTKAYEDESQYGVHIAPDYIALFRGTVFSESDPETIRITAPNTVEIANITLTGGGDDIIFKRLTGETDEYGTFEVRLISDASKVRTITIEKTGVVSVE